MMSTHLDDGLANKRVEVRHQFAVNVRHVQVLRDDGDEAHGAVPDPQVWVTQERSYGRSHGTNDITPDIRLRQLRVKTMSMVLTCVQLII